MKTLIKSAGLAIALSAAVLPTAASAQSASILVVDIARLFSDSAAAKSATSQIKAKYEGNLNTANTAYNTAVTTLNTQIEAARKLQKPDGSLPAASQTAVGNAQTAYNQAGQRFEALQNEVSTVQRYVQSQILRGAEPVIEQVRNERKAAIVVPKNGTLANDAATDITSTVVQRLDQSLKTVSINLPQQPAAGGAPAAAPAAQPQGR
jgi:Skp family chaperone for outer membrane proteins